MYKITVEWRFVVVVIIVVDIYETIVYWDWVFDKLMFDWCFI